MGVDIFTLTKKTPNVKFFFTPNITPSKYPFLYQEQKDYIKNKLVKFAITYNYADNNELFQKILEDNNFKPVCKDSSGYVLYEYTN